MWATDRALLGVTFLWCRRIVGWKTAQRFPPEWRAWHGAFRGGAAGCASHGASLSLASPRESNHKRRRPLHPGLAAARPDFPHCGAAPRARHEGTSRLGGPAPSFVTRSAPMPRVPLRNACVRPPEGGSPSRLKDRKVSFGVQGATYRPSRGKRHARNKSVRHLWWRTLRGFPHGPSRRYAASQVTDSSETPPRPPQTAPRWSG